MKKLFFVLSLLSFVTVNAQRCHDISKQVLYELFQAEISSWEWKGYDIVKDSKCNIEYIKRLNNGKFVTELISKKTFDEKNLSMVSVPQFDSTGEMTGHVNREVKPIVSGLFWSKELSNDMKIGFIFSHGDVADEDKFSINDNNIFVAVNPAQLDVVTQKSKLLFLELLNSIDFNLDSCVIKKYNINGKDNNLFILPTNFFQNDTIVFIHEITDKLFTVYNSDFNKTYYTKDVNNFMTNEDKYGNSQLKEMPQEYDTLDILNVTTDTYKKTVLNTLETRELNAVSLCFSYDRTSDKTNYHVGARKDVYTSSGINLGSVDHFLKSEDAKKIYSKKSNALITFLLEVYR